VKVDENTTNVVKFQGSTLEFGLRILRFRPSTANPFTSRAMSNVNPQSNNLKNVPPKDAEKTEKDQPAKSVAPLEEDDEFEDFPVEGNPTILGLGNAADVSRLD
jgi:hypothetical protein